MIHTIDTGVHLSARASGDRHGLRDVGVIVNSGRPEDAAYWPPCQGDTVICEVPVFRSKFTDAIGALRQVVGRHQLDAERTGATWIQLKPEEWKGQEKKWHQHRRLWQVLTPYERELIVRFLRRPSAAEIENWIVAACTKHALGGKVSYGRGRKINGKPFKDNDCLDSVAMFMKKIGRLK
jgi:hypothetical protein